MRRVLLILAFWQTIAAMADDGRRLWLRLPDAEPAAVVDMSGASQAGDADQAIVRVAVGELRAHWQGLPVALRLTDEPTLRRDAFRIAKVEEDSFRITASSAVGLLYGAYFMLRSQTMGDGCLCQTLPPSHELTESPQNEKRCFAVRKASLLLKRSTAFARAAASIGINEVVLPANQDKKAAQLADALRPYGISVRCADDATAAPLPLTSDDNWTGDHLRQFDLYAAGRRLWQPDITDERLAYEWLAQTFSDNPLFIIPMRDALLSHTGADAIERLLETWQELQQFIDDERYDDVRQQLQAQLEAENQ